MLATLVLFQGPDETRPQAHPHLSEVSRDGVGQGERCRSRKQRGLQTRLHETVGDGFLVPKVHQAVHQALAGQSPFREGRQYLRHGRVLLGDGIVAKHARDFLDEVLLDGDVETPARRLYVPTIAAAGHLHAQGHEDGFDAFGRHRDTEDAVEARPAKDHRRAQGQLRRLFRRDDGARSAPANLEQQRRSALHGSRLQGRVHAALEALRGVRMQPMTAGAAGNGIRGEPSHFQEDVSGFARQDA